MSERSYVVAGGELITWKVRGRPGDAYSLFENLTQPGYAGPPPPEVIERVLAGARRHQIEIPPPPETAY